VWVIFALEAAAVHITPGLMIVCSCNILSDHDARTVLTAERTPTTSQVYGCLGCSPQCGRCAHTIRRILDEAIAGASGADCRR
jgi:bacterioferritin-associated ferredoxin